MLKNKIHDIATNHHAIYFLLQKVVVTKKREKVLGRRKEKSNEANTSEVRRRETPLSFSSVDRSKQIIIHSSAMLCRNTIS
jgi:hypothetical protein